MKKIKFQDTKITVSGRLYSELVESLQENILEMFAIPKIIVFTNNKNNFLKYNEDYTIEKNSFYNYGEIAIAFNQIKIF